MTAQLEALDTLLQTEPAGEHEPVQQAGGITHITLKSGDAVLITDDHGDFHPAKREMGLFWHGTRFLHVCNLSLYEQPLTMLCYDIANAGDACQFDLTNAPFTTASQRHIAQGEIHIHRQVELRYNQCIQTFIVTSFHDDPVSFMVGLDIESDFCDMFEVWGWVRQARGELHVPVQENESLLLSYRGLDAVERKTLVTLTPPTTISPSWSSSGRTLKPRSAGLRNTAIEMAIPFSNIRPHRNKDSAARAGKMPGILSLSGMVSWRSIRSHSARCRATRMQPTGL